ncbi:SGNH hydrolase-type esterase domain-containing protein [Mrakia frigida]|uniref:SGNH/GDSL hydrolase family protein n=1 Tax=Mrakia frigida TaxID=29902 RepID=UPI003FCC0E82
MLSTVICILLLLFSSSNFAAAMGLEPQNVLLTFGDSLTQTWEEGSLNQRLAYSYCRKLDVINRGFGGYNTEWAIPILEQTLASTTSSSPEIKLMTIWFGANDACISPSPQHLSLSKFTSNLHKIITLVRTSSPSTSIVLITPPPISPDDRASAIYPRPLDRDPEVTKQYAEAVIAVAKETKLPVVDLWNGVVDAVEGGEKNVGSVMRDGLHLNKAGYKILYDLLIPVINENYPSLNFETMQNVWPGWAEIDPADPVVVPRSTSRTRDEL